MNLKKKGGTVDDGKVNRKGTHRALQIHTRGKIHTHTQGLLRSTEKETYTHTRGLLRSTERERYTHTHMLLRPTSFKGDNTALELPVLSD